MSKERLVELIYDYDQKVERQYHSKEGFADYLLAKGVIVPTVNLGDKVWCIDSDEICEAVVVKVEYNFYTTPSEWITLRIDSSFIGAYESRWRTDLILGKKIFLTREEAEAKLKEGENK